MTLVQKSQQQKKITVTLLRVTLSTEELIQPLKLSAFFTKSKLSAVLS